jgi:hypothetical protein
MVYSILSMKALERNISIEEKPESKDTNSGTGKQENNYKDKQDSFSHTYSVPMSPNAMVNYSYGNRRSL